MFDWLWDVAQDRELREARHDLQRARTDTDARLQSLEDRVNALTLMNQALVGVLEERAGIAAEDVAARMQELDLADGALDARAATPRAACAKCARVIGTRHRRCMYCGAPRPNEPPLPR